MAASQHSGPPRVRKLRQTLMREKKPVRACRVCRCTDDDCRGCIERTGKPCRWVGRDLCSACAPLGATFASALSSPSYRARYAGQPLLRPRSTGAQAMTPQHELAMTRAAMETRRMDAWAMYSMGARPHMVAHALRVSRTTASRWSRAYAAGKSELRTIATGRPQDVDRDDIAELIRKNGIQSAVALRRAIGFVHGRFYDLDHCYRLLKRLKGSAP